MTEPKLQILLDQSLQRESDLRKSLESLRARMLESVDPTLKGYISDIDIALSADESHAANARALFEEKLTKL